MEVTRYIFQSPYSSQVQVGRADTTTTGGQKSGQGSAELIKNTNESVNDAMAFKATQIQEVKPSVSSDASLDVYA